MVINVFCCVLVYRKYFLSNKIQREYCNMRYQSTGLFSPKTRRGARVDEFHLN